MTGPKADLAAPRVQFFEVVNNNDFEIRDMYDGVPIVFPKGEKVDISPEIALHCFGWPGEDQDRAEHMARRYGWSGRDYLRPEGPNNALPRYAVLSALVTITPVYYTMVRVNPNAPVPADTGDESDDRPTPPMDVETTTRAGKRKKTKVKADRHRVATMRAGR